MSNVKVEKTEIIILETLKQMEKMVDEKLANLKVATPILFTIITSVVAFLFVDDIADATLIKLYSGTIGVLLIAFLVLLLSYFGKSSYKPIVMNVDSIFSPYDLTSYCFLADEKFLESLSIYAGRILSENELLSASFLKQKINEYVAKKIYVSIALSILILGTAILVVIFLFGAFIFEG